MSQISQFQRSLIVSALGLLLFGCERLSVQFKGVRLPASSNSINGIVQPIASSSALSLSKVSSLSCTTAEAKLIALDGTGKRILPAKATTQVQADGRYSFNNLSSIGISSSSFLSSSRYIVEIHGCTESYARIVTGLNSQNINYGTSLLSWMAETQYANTLTTVPLEKIEELGAMISSAASTDAAFTRLTSDASVSTAFNSAFGIAPTTLPEAAPRIESVTLPSSFGELASASMSATIKHWSSTYPMAYEWKMDGTLISTSGSATWIPGANSQGSHTLTLRVGRSNGGGIDSSKPVESKSFEISVENTVLPLAPVLSIASEYVNTPSLILSLNTGALVDGSPANCASFSSLALVESDDSSPVTAAPAAGAFTISCSGAGPQSLSYSLATGEGTKTLRLWARDASGQISSTPRTLQVQYSTSGPTLTFVSPAAATPSNGSLNLSGTCTTAAGNISISGDVASPSNVTCSAGSFTTSVSLSGGDGTKTVSIAQTDVFGNTTTASRNFRLDTVAPVLAINSPAPSAYLNAAGVSAVAVTGTCSEDVTVQLRATGGATNVTASPVCSSGAFSATLDLSTLPEGSVSLSGNASDTATNAAVAVGISLVKDTTPPAVTLSGTPSSPSRTTLLNVTVAGTGVTHYQYKVGAASSVNCAVSGGYSSDVALAASLASDISGSADGSMKLCVIGKDAAGNYQALASATAHTWTKDASVSPFGALSVNPIGPSQNNKPTISGATEALSGVELYTATACSGSAIATASADSSGNFSLTPGSSIGSEGSYNFYVKATDPLGNTLCSPSPVSYTLDVTAPALAFVSVGVQNQISNTNHVTFSGSCEAGRSISVSGTDSGGVTCTSGSWIYQTSDRTTDTTYNYTFTQTDAAGNTATLSGSWVRDTVAPAFTWSTPVAGGSAQTGITVTGTCEVGTPVAFSGSGLLSSYSVACSSGSFSSNLFFSSGDGSKSITIGQTDSAGNSTANTRSFTRDQAAPVLTQTTRSSPSYTSGNSVAFGGACESGLTISITRDGSNEGTASCNSSIWSYTTATQSADATRDYVFTQTDAALNSSSVGARWVRDTVAPTLVFTSSASQFTSGDSVIFAGSCEGTLPITIAGAASATSACAGGSWTYSPTATTDATRTYTFTQTDFAGNTTSPALSGTWERNTTGPIVTVTTATVKNTANSASFSGACTDGLTLSVSGSATTTLTCSSGTWSYTPTAASDAARTYQVSQTDALSRTSTVNLSWLRDTTPPALTTSQFLLNAGNATTSSRSLSVALRASDSLSNVTHFCLKTNVTTAPAATDTCWIDVTAPSPGLTPALTLTLSGFAYNLDFVDGSYSVHAWVRDALGNSSSLTASGSGTAAQDKASITLTQGAPPVLTNLTLSRSDSSIIPPATADQTVLSGSTAYIKWQLSDDSSLPVNAVRLFFTTDDSTWSEIPTNGGVANAASTGCTVSAPQTGCYAWTSPTNSYYRVRAVATDSTNAQAVAISNSVNLGAFRILAGNPGNGLDGDAKQAVLFNDPGQDLSAIAQGQFVITRKGDFYFADHNRGIMKVDPADGLLKTYIRQTGTSSGDGGPAGSSTLRYALRIILDSQDRLVVWDYDRIRRVNLDLASPTIETLAGGGSDTSATIANPRLLRIAGVERHNWIPIEETVPLYAAADGKIYFRTEAHDSAWNRYNGAIRVRIYRGDLATPRIESLVLGGTGMRGDPAQPLTGCAFGSIGFAFSPLGSLEYIFGFARSFASAAYGTSGSCLGADRWNPVHFDPVSGQSSGVHPDTYNGTYAWSSGQAMLAVTGRDGKLYFANRNTNRIYRFNHDATAASAGSYTLLAGNGTRIQCADGTLATSCGIDILGVFIDEQSRLYINDAGRIRMVKADNTITTLLGSPASAGDGGSALLARFNDVFNLDIDPRTYPAKIVVNELGATRLREITVDGNVTTIAGNGIPGWASTTALATATSVSLKSWDIFSMPLIEPSTGNIYMTQANERLSRLVRSTGKWEHVVGGGATNYPSGDGVIGSQLSLLPGGSFGMWSRPTAFGLANGLLLASHAVNGTADGQAYGAYLKTYDLADSFRQSHVAGKNELRASGATYPSVFCPAGEAIATCRVPMNSHDSHYYTRAYYDSVDNKWMVGRTSLNEVVVLTPGQTRTSIALANAITSFAYRRVGSTETIYYCSRNSGRLYKKVVGGSTETMLTWPIPGMKCTGNAMVIDESRGTLIFPYYSDGLTGVAESPEL